VLAARLQKHAFLPTSRVSQNKRQTRMEKWERAPQHPFPVFRWEAKKLLRTQDIKIMGVLALLMPLVFVGTSLRAYQQNVEDKAALHRRLTPALETLRDTYKAEGNERGAAHLQQQILQEQEAAEVYENMDPATFIAVVKKQLQTTSSAGVTGYGLLGYAVETEAINQAVFAAVLKRGVQPGVHIGWPIAHTPLDRFMNESYEGLSVQYGKRDFWLSPGTTM